MDATFNGFSIRDYTSKMRSIDVFKCWPFTTNHSNNVTAKEVQSWLPPMTVPNFRCCSNELDALRSNQDDSAKPENQTSEEEVSRSDDSESVKSAKSAAADEEKLEMVCPVCRDFNAATLTAVNAHIDGCLAQTMREERRHMRMMSLKSKSKAPKKRSIAEIFKVEEQPQIETVLKLWPFSEDPDEVSITVTKFRWLSRRLKALRSNRANGEILKNGDESVKSDEGDSVEEKLEMVCPVCRVFNATTVTAVNAHIDGCLTQAMREERRQMRRSSSNSKPKTPKKMRTRSIAEILTVAPQIEASNSEVIEVEDEDKKEEDEGNGKEEVSDYVGGDSSGAAAAAVVSTIKRKKSTNKNRKKKKMKKVKKKSKVEKHSDSDRVVYLNNEKKTMVSKKKKKKKKNLFNHELTAKKEDACKRKLQTPVNSSRKLKAKVGNKMVALDDMDASAHNMKSVLKILSVEKKQKVKICNSVGKQQKVVSPVRGFLKNHLKHASESTSSGCNIQDETEEIHCDDQVPTSDRHVKFSSKDDILGSKMRNSFDETAFNLSSDALATSLVKEQSSGSDEENESLEGNINYDHITTNIDKREEVCPIVDSKQFSNSQEQVSVQNFLKPCTNEEKSKHLVEQSESLNKVAFCDYNNNSHLFDGCNTATLHCSPYADISAIQAAPMSGINTQSCESGAFSSTGKFIDHLEDPAFPVTTVNSTANTRTFLEPSSSYSASYDKANERCEFPLETCGDNDNGCQALGCRQLPHMFSADMIDNSFPFPGWGKGSVRNNCLDQNFYGLPLNSHGELINFSSSGKVGMNQLETSSTLRGSVSSLLVNNILDQSSQDNNLSINERHVVQKTFPKDGPSPFPHYPARLAVIELQGCERADIHQPNPDMCSGHHVQPLDSEMNLMRNPFIEQNQHDQVQNHKGNGMISVKGSSDLISPSSSQVSQPTVRLMGKDVPIGRSSIEMQQFAGDVWADEESRRRHYSEFAALENSLLGRCSKQDWISGSPFQISAENTLQSAKIQSNQALEGTLLMNGPDSEYPHQYLQNNHVSQNGSLRVSRNASSNFRPITQAPTSRAVLNGAPDNFPEKCIPGAKPLRLRSESQVLRAPSNLSQPNCLSNGELNERNKHPHVTKLAFEFPFLHPVVDELAKTGWFQSSDRSSPSWLSSSTDERLPGTFSPQFSGISGRSFPQNLWGNNFIMPSINHSAEVLYPLNPLTSHCPMKTPLGPAPSVQPPHVPVTPSTMNGGCRNIIRATDRVRLDDTNTIKEHHPCSSTRKRPASNLEDSRKSIKLPNIQVQENLSCMTGSTQENSSAELQENTRTVKHDPRVDSARSRCFKNGAKNLNPISYPVVGSFELDGTGTELQQNTRTVKHDPRVDSARSRYFQNEAQNLNPRSYPVVGSFKRDGTVTSGPVGRSPGAKRIIKSSQNGDRDGSKPIHSAVHICDY